MRNVFLLLLTIISFCANAQIKGKIISVRDGDTFDFISKSGESYRVRLAEVDCPEYKSHNSLKNQPYGEKAYQYAFYQVYGKEVFLVKKGSKSYGRTVGHIIYGGKNLSEELLRMGFAWQDKRYSSNIAYGSLQDSAKRASRGLWNEKDPIEPWLWRRGKRK